MQEFRWKSQIHTSTHSYPPQYIIKAQKPNKVIDVNCSHTISTQTTQHHSLCLVTRTWVGGKFKNNTIISVGSTRSSGSSYSARYLYLLKRDNTLFNILPRNSLLYSNITQDSRVSKNSC